MGGGEPGANVLRGGIAGTRVRGDLRQFAGGGARATYIWVDSGWVGDPSQSAGGDAGDAVGDAVAVAEFLCAIFEKADQCPVDVAEAEEAEVVGADGDSSGAKAQ